MEQAPARLFYVAGIVAASLVIFTGSLSYTLGDHSRRAEKAARAGTTPPATAPRATAPSAPAPPAVAPQPAPLTRPAGTGTAGSAAPPAPAPAPQSKNTTHLTQSGETLTLIAWLYGVDPGAIRAANGLTADRIQAGQPLKIPGAEPLRRHSIAQGETLWEVAARFGVDMEDLLAANRGIGDAGQVQIGQRLVIPPETGTAVAALATPEDASVLAAYAGVFTWPLLAPVSSPFGPRWGGMHTGVDLAASMNEPIKAARDGEVLTVGVVPGYGNTVILRHQDGTRSLYAHASKLLVRSGQQVKRGDVIALVGSTGHSSGPHLHFEIIVNNRPRDPLALLPHR